MRYFLANWKMHTTVDQALTSLEAIQTALRAGATPGADPLPRPIVCPPFVSLVPMREVVDDGLVALGAQNCHWEREGPYTGEVSPAMLEGLVDYVMVGHSERRAAGETDDQMARKVAAVVDAGIVPILFVGEEEPTDAAVPETQEQLDRRLRLIDPAAQELLVVYEPAWAVGAERAAGADHVGRVVRAVKDHLGRRGVEDPLVLYGGTVNDENVEDFAGVGTLDGLGATRASLDAERLVGLLERIALVRAGSAP